ncbi:maintenance of telomere capping protein 1 [Trichoderma novae-zelandiae]
MASKKSKTAPADDNLDELFSGIGNDSKAKKPPKKPTSAAAAAKAIGNDDILADLESELAPLPASRPHTPRLKEAIARRSTATPPAGDDGNRTAAARKSTDSSRSLRASFTPSATSSELHDAERRAPAEQPQPQQSGSGWWGGILSTATGVIKQAEAAYNQIQQNEEAQKWAEQVKGLRTGIDVNTLKSYGDELRNRALPTLSNIINTIAPPIGSHERLFIHITHDLVGYPSLDPLIYDVFADVMQQVEGGELKVVQRGHDSASSRAHDNAAGWDDGPWWRQVDQPRELGIVKGLVEGTKLCRVNAESYASEYFAAEGGIEAVKTKARSGVTEPGSVRTSHVFLSVQAIVTDQDKTLFGRTAAAAREKKESSGPDEEEEENEDEFRFAIFIVDPVHEIEYATISQPIPAKWARWLEAPSPLTPQSGDDVPGSLRSRVPEDIRSLVEEGELDPREWVAGWIKDSLTLSAGIVAQWYVARRMQVGVSHAGTRAGEKKVDDEDDEEEEEEEESDEDTE